jgi:alpha-ketoglutarate-dependent 2,4-dichlorophenoxyacetate dioxygenase
LTLSIQPIRPDFIAEVRGLDMREPPSPELMRDLAAHAMMIHGMAIPEGRILLRDLMEHATQSRFVHTQTWAAGDMVMWDNRCTMHRACEYDPAEIRELRRTTVMKHASTLAQAA